MAHEVARPGKVERVANRGQMVEMRRLGELHAEEVNPLTAPAWWTLQNPVADAVLHAREACLHINDRPECLMGGNVGEAFIVDPDLASIAQALALLVPGTDHLYSAPR